MPAEPDVIITSTEAVDNAIRQHLKELGITFEELRAQAHSGVFQAETARLCWLAFGTIGDPDAPDRRKDA